MIAGIAGTCGYSRRSLGLPPQRRLTRSCRPQARCRPHLWTRPLSVTPSSRAIAVAVRGWSPVIVIGRNWRCRDRYAVGRFSYRLSTGRLTNGRCDFSVIPIVYRLEIALVPRTSAGLSRASAPLAMGTWHCPTSRLRQRGRRPRARPCVPRSAARTGIRRPVSTVCRGRDGSSRRGVIADALTYLLGEHDGQMRQYTSTTGRQR